MALREVDYETIMINNNPETVSTDYDTADKLYFEPLTLEDVLSVIDQEKPEGVIVQFGGQTPLKLARGLEAAGVHILGTSPESIDLAEDRERFGRLIKNSKIRLPDWGTASTFTEAKEIAGRIGYPILVRPSYVLGGRGMEIVYDEDSLDRYITEAAGIPWAKIAAKVMVGKTLKELGIKETPLSDMVAIKTPVFPFMKFPNVQTYLGPEMRSTGEVMGFDHTFGGAFAKAQFAAGHGLPKRGNAFVSVNDNDKVSVVPIARQLYEMGFGIIATHGTYQALRKAGIPVQRIQKVVEGRPNVLDRIINSEIQFVINTPLGKISRSDEYSIARVAIAHDVPCLTTLSAAWAAIQAIRSLQAKDLDVCSLQESSFESE